jgi:predicted RNase H-like nuclease (RuvC/YqgF family)
MDWRKHPVQAETSCRDALASALAAFCAYEERKATWREVVTKVREYGNARECASCKRYLVRPIACRPSFADLITFTANMEPP